MPVTVGEVIYMSLKSNAVVYSKTVERY